MAYSSYRGWYQLLNPDKFIRPIDEHMGSYRQGAINYKSRLELNAFKYADFNKHVKNWSIEPFAIHYIKPTDWKPHRYYVDMFLEFTSGDKFIVEVKSKGETLLPKPPSKPTEKSIKRYQEALSTYAVNQAKWRAAKDFAQKNKIRFVILTEDELYSKPKSKSK